METPKRFSGRFNEIIDPHLPVVWSDAEVAQELTQTAPVAEAAPERVYFPLPDENGKVPPTQYKRPAPKPKPAGYRYFDIPVAPPTHTDAVYFPIPTQGDK